MLLGVAIGDALGNRTESMLPHEREAQYGRITGYLPSRYANGQPAGTPSDDTQLTFRAIEQLLADGALDPDELAFRIANDRIFGIGRATRQFCDTLRTGVPWQEATQASAGNGALIRIAPTLLPHLREGGAGLWADAALSTAVTHETRVPSGPLHQWRGSLGELLDSEVRPAVARGQSVREAGNRWHSGAYLMETVPCVMHIVAQCGHDPREAMLVAVNDTRDNDTIAAIVGGAMGAAHGTAWIPTEWREQLLGRVNGDDDGKVFTLIDEAVAKFVG
jgi:ADP-ribosylglycohydrolase